MLSEPERRELWSRLIETIEGYFQGVETARVAPELDPGRVRAGLEQFSFEEPIPAVQALEAAAEGLWRDQVHTPHPRYFGLFNPNTTTMGIAADAMAAAFNPQLAAWSHSPFANEVERHLVKAFGSKFGYAEVDGTFTSGGAEANQTAVLCALAAKWPEVQREGVRVLDRAPVFYVSSESHHSFQKAARASGLGLTSVRVVPADDRQQMDVVALRRMIEADRTDGKAPFLLVATCGTTGAGAIDPLPELATICGEFGLWLHADAAWGGGLALVPEHRPLLAGIERADSITFDTHKWMSVPMGAGLFLTRHLDALSQTFGIETSYMPKEGRQLDVTDPYVHSIQWSRRFIGLKVFLSLAVAGWEGYAESIRHQFRMGDALREGLVAAGWELANQTTLPLVCFRDSAGADP
jgi:glutamate/tyrosine decarboxylase-like PLP-dependent enzyme